MHQMGLCTEGMLFSNLVFFGPWFGNFNIFEFPFKGGWHVHKRKTHHPYLFNHCIILEIFFVAQYSSVSFKHFLLNRGQMGFV